MFETPASRAVALVCLLVALGGMTVWHGTLEPAPELGDYPDHEHLVQSPEEFVGQRISLGMRVVGTDPVTARVTYRGVTKRVVVENVDHPVDVGDTLRVFGVLEDPTTIVAENSFAVPARGRTYTYLVSFLAGLWTLSRIVRTWRFDSTAVGLVPRSGVSSVRSLLDGGDRDA